VFERFDAEAHAAVEAARSEATGLGHNYLGTEHLLLERLRPGELGSPTADGTSPSPPARSPRPGGGHRMGERQPTGVPKVTATRR
jgi:Clp amino terminal domain, pathogenicity island component